MSGVSTSMVLNDYRPPIYVVTAQEGASGPFGAVAADFGAGVGAHGLTVQGSADELRRYAAAINEAADQADALAGVAAEAVQA